MQSQHKSSTMAIKRVHEDYEEKNHNYEANLSDWQHAITDIGLKLKAVISDKKKGRERLKRLNLPSYKASKATLMDFLREPEKYFNLIGSKKFYISLEPIDDKHARYSACDLTGEEVIEYILNHLQEQDTSQYDLVLQEFFENMYGGTMVINDNGSVFIEFVRGFQGQIAHGRKEPEFIAKYDPLAGLMKYSFEDPNLKEALYKALLCIPHRGQERNMVFEPGYYEFSLVEGPIGLRPIFIDASDNGLLRNV